MQATSLAALLTLCCVTLPAQVFWQQRHLAERRADHAMAYDLGRQRVVLFGGRAPGFGQDTWEWDGATWTRRFPANSPSARGGHRMAFDSVRARVLLFGGTDGSGVLNDTWAWDGSD